MIARLALDAVLAVLFGALFGLVILALDIVWAVFDLPFWV